MKSSSIIVTYIPISFNNMSKKEVENDFQLVMFIHLLAVRQEIICTFQDSKSTY